MYANLLILKVFLMAGAHGHLENGAMSLASFFFYFYYFEGRVGFKARDQDLVRLNVKGRDLTRN